MNTRDFRDSSSGDLLEFLQHSPSLCYAYFLDERKIRRFIAEEGFHLKMKLDFRYDEDKRVRACFFSFPEAKGECELACICLAYFGSRQGYHAYAYEYFQDGSIGLVEVTQGRREILAQDVGEDIDDYFMSICSYAPRPDGCLLSLVSFDPKEGGLYLLDCFTFDLGDLLKKRFGRDVEPVAYDFGEFDFLLYSASPDTSQGFIALRQGKKGERLPMRIKDLNTLRVYAQPEPYYDA